MDEELQAIIIAGQVERLEDDPVDGRRHWQIERFQPIAQETAMSVSSTPIAVSASRRGIRRAIGERHLDLGTRAHVFQQHVEGVYGL